MTDLLEDMLPVSLDTIQAAGHLEADLYMLDERRLPKLYRGRSFPLVGDDLAKLRQRGTKCLYMTPADANAYREHVRSHIVNDESLSLERRVDLVRETSRAVVEESWRQGAVDAMLWVANDFTDQMTTLVTSKRFAFRNLLDAMSDDYSPYLHGTNVCSVAVFLAKTTGRYSAADLVQIAKGALLHDIGKQSAAAADEKRGLSGGSKAQRAHPTLGLRKFASHQGISWGTLMMIYQHHEQPDGKGYPVGVPGDEIHEWARICAAANYFEKQRRLHHEATRESQAKLLASLESRAGTMLDRELTEALLTLVAENEVAAV